MPEPGATGYGLLWADLDDCGALDPTWTATPDIVVIQQLATEHLSQHDCSVISLGEGAFNKLYLITSPGFTKKYLVRVALPVDPFFKTESEVATMAFLQRYTSLPIPKVVAYSSSAANDLRFEWMLLEYVEGTPLSDLWENISYSAKSSLTVQVREYFQDMRKFEFSWIGNLYFSTVRDQVNGQPAEWARSSTDDPGSDEEFVIGRVVSPWFFRDKRVHLNADRGPFKSSGGFMLAMTDMQIERIKHLSPNPSDGYYCETDEYLAKHESDVLETCNGLRNLVPKIFTQGTDESRVLSHSDMSGNNVILNPDTLELRGIIDWESVGIVPLWKAAKVPHFLLGIEVPDPPPVGDPEADEESLVEIRKDWEKVRLRQLFLGCQSGIKEKPDLTHKLKFTRSLEEMEFRWTAAKNWLPALADPNHPKWELRLKYLIR